MVLAYFGQPVGQGWTQVGELAIAPALSTAVGVEREIRQKIVRLRTHTLAGFASASIMSTRMATRSSGARAHGLGQW
jgi:putative Mg2+ transporter-C (MgtC) family protein